MFLQPGSQASHAQIPESGCLRATEEMISNFSCSGKVRQAQGGHPGHPGKGEKTAEDPCLRAVEKTGGVARARAGRQELDLCPTSELVYLRDPQADEAGATDRAAFRRAIVAEEPAREHRHHLPARI